MADLEDLVEAIDQLRKGTPRLVVAITGFGGAGKSTLTKTLVDAVAESVRLRGDDFLDPERSHRRSPDWDGVERVRMRSQVLEPFRAGDAVTFQPYDWNVGELGPITSLPPASVLLVDSIGVVHPDLEGCFDLTVWVDVDLETAGRQGCERDRRSGHDHERLWAEVWTPNDKDFAANFDPQARVDLFYRPSE